MDISDDYRQLITKEINYVVKKMNESSSAEEKLYYFSGVYGVFHRVFNIQYDAELVFAHFILKQTHNSLIGRLQAITKGAETAVPLQEEHFKKLTSITKELGTQINSKKEITNTLKKFAILSFATTGNGYYLQQKGLLKI